MPIKFKSNHTVKSYFNCKTMWMSAAAAVVNNSHISLWLLQNVL